MWIFNSAFGKIFDLLFLPFRSMSPWIGMILISFLTGLLMLFVFKQTSNQKGIQKVKNRIKAHLLELRLFKDSLGQSLRSQGSILRCNLKYIGYSAKPMLVMILPLILIIIQLNFWFGYESLEPNESAILKVKLREDQNPFEMQIAVQPSSGLVMETPPLRIEESQEIDWRFSATQEGIHQFTVTINGQAVSKKVAVAQKPLSRISPLKTNRKFLDQALYPTEPPIKGKIPVRTIEIQYPTKSMNLFGWKIHWLIVFFVLSIIFGFAFKGVFKVQI
jgi:uncharacterized membrane protein (DUF106 family)